MTTHAFHPVLAIALCALNPTPCLGAAPASDAFQIRMATERTSTLNAALVRLNVPAGNRGKLAADFAALPQEAQDAVLARLDPGFAAKVFLPAAPSFVLIPDAATLLAPTIQEIYPAQGQTGQTSVIIGRNLSAPACEVTIDGKVIPSHAYLGMRLVKLPASVSPGTTHDVLVRNTQLNRHSEWFTYKVVAARGYRGIHGWKFPNFGSPELGWNLFRDYFGAAAVEFPGGLRRPSAQAWYDSTYKGVAKGGDCFGMSVRSVRTRLHAWTGPAKSWWPSHVKPTVWDYDSGAEVLDSIREDQAGQLCLQAMAVITDRAHHQDHSMATLFILTSLAAALNAPAQQPILGIWQGKTKGHAVIPYRVENSGGAFRISLYDNNKPYRESELNDNGSLATVSANTFSYGGWDRMIAYTFAEVAPATPWLPIDAMFAQGSLGADTAVLVVDDPSAVRQISDEAGRTFYQGTGENRHPGSRIPDSMRFVPMTGGEVPADYPAIFVFNKARGRALTVDLTQAKPGAVRLFSAGKLMTLVGQSGRIQFQGLHTAAQTLKVADPVALKLQEVSVLASETDRSEKVYRLDGLAGIQKGLEVQLDPKGVLVSHGMAGAAGLGIQVKRFSAAGMDEGAVHKLSIPASQRGLVKPDFANLKQAPVIELRKM